MDSSKMNFIQKHHIKRLYVRFFDVVRDADGEIMPNATLQFDTTDENMTTEEKEKEFLMPKGMEIIPVVYIVNDCFKAKPRRILSAATSRTGNLQMKHPGNSQIRF